GKPPQRFPFFTDRRNDLRPTHFVKRSCGSKVLERNGLQGIDVKEKKHPDCGYITGDFGDALKQFETSPLVPTSDFLPNECTRDVHGEPCLGDARIGAPFWQQMQILDAAVQYIQRV